MRYACSGAITAVLRKWRRTGVRPSCSEEPPAAGDAMDPGAAELYDQALLGILQHAGNVQDFLRVLFGFLYRKTDFYRLLRHPSDRMGFPPGAAQALVLQVTRGGWGPDPGLGAAGPGPARVLLGSWPWCPSARPRVSRDAGGFRVARGGPRCQGLRVREGELCTPQNHSSHKLVLKTISSLKMLTCNVIFTVHQK